MSRYIPMVSLNVNAIDLEKYSHLLQTGFIVEAEYGRTLHDIMRSLPGFTDSYIENDVHAIFLNGTAIDDIDIPMVQSGDVVALSAWMPSHLSNSLHRRDVVQERPVDVGKEGQETISLTIKLFNIIADDRGLEVLNQGVRMRGKTVHNFLKVRPWLLGDYTTVKVDDTVVTDIDQFFNILKENEYCQLSLN